MEMTTKNLLSKILAHQLEGIMLHFDLMTNYKVMGMERMACKHFKHMKEECECHAKTVMKIIDKYHEPVIPEARARIPVQTVLNKPKDILDKFTLHTQYLEAWKKWEQDTVTMYADVVSVAPDCKWWPALKTKAEHEIRCIERIMSDLA